MTPLLVSVPFALPFAAKPVFWEIAEPLAVIEQLPLFHATVVVRLMVIGPGQVGGEASATAGAMATRAALKASVNALNFGGCIRGAMKSDLRLIYRVAPYCDVIAIRLGPAAAKLVIMREIIYSVSIMTEWTRLVVPTRAAILAVIHD